MIYRQGDVLLKSIPELPVHENLRKKTLVLAEGEVTGHCHQFIDHTTVSVYELENIQYVRALEDAALVHDEHDTLLIPAGLYEVVQQREVDLLGEIQKVMD